MEKYHGNTVEYWKQNAEEDYIKTPISVLKYITVLEEQAEQLRKHAVMQRSEQLVCDKCTEGLNKSKSFEKGTCVHCRKKIEQTNCA